MDFWSNKKQEKTVPQSPVRWYGVSGKLSGVFVASILYVILLYTGFIFVIQTVMVESILANIDNTFPSWVLIGLFLVLYFLPPRKFLWRRGKKYYIAWIFGMIFTVALVIGIQSTINSEPQKGTNSALKSYMSNYRALAEVYFVTHNQSYKGFCDDATLDTTKEAISSHIGVLPACFDNDVSYAAEIRLKEESDGFFCVDSGGNALATKQRSISSADHSCGN
jgi:hypothetical protein